MAETLAIVSVVLGMFIFIPLLAKILNFVGRKAGVWKNYFQKKGQRYGLNNAVETRIGKLPVVPLEFLKAILLFLGLLILLGVLPEIKILEEILQLLTVGAGLYGLYILGVFFNCSCVYCSTRREEVERYIEKISRRDQFFKCKITEIQFEDSWYMIFNKGPEEYKKSMELHPNFYVMECPERLKKLNSFRYELLYLFPGILIGAGCIYVASKFFSINQDITGFLMLLAVAPGGYRLIGERAELYKECKARFREEQNLPENKYKVEGHYSGAEGGRLIFTVKPIDENKGELK